MSMPALEIACGAASAVTTFTVCEGLQLNTWESILVAVVSALVFAIFNIGTKIITSILVKKGLISSDAKEKIDEQADDLADDGKLNGSNKIDEPKEKKEEEK